MNSIIRELLAKHGGLSVPVETLADAADLYDAGLSSFASVQLMLALEEEFDIEFPETHLNRRSFSSIAAIASAVSQVVGQAAVA